MTARTFDLVTLLRRRTAPSGDCLVWLGGKDGKGYGLLKVAGKTQRAHRVAWQNSNGPIPSGMMVLHRCDNPPCCKLDHLFLGTNVDNMRDMVAKGRSPRGATEHNVNAKLSNAQVVAMRQRFARGDVSCPDMAAQFGVSPSNAWLILTGRSRIDAGGPIGSPKCPPGPKRGSGLRRAS